MPTFDYKCPKCGQEVLNERVQNHDDKVICTAKGCDETRMIKQICAPNIGGMDKAGRSGSTKLPD